MRNRDQERADKRTDLGAKLAVLALSPGWSGVKFRVHDELTRLTKVTVSRTIRTTKPGESGGSESP